LKNKIYINDQILVHFKRSHEIGEWYTTKMRAYF